MRTSKVATRVAVGKLCAAAVAAMATLFAVASAEAQAPPGLVAHYTFDSNDATDSSGNGHDGTLVGSPGFAPGPSGFGSSLVVDLGTFVTLPDTSTLSLYNHDFTVTAWINAAAFSGLGGYGGDWAVLGNRLLGGGGGLHLVLRDGYPYMGFLGNDIGSGSLLSLNTWYHIAWRYTLATGEMALFKDGVLISSGGGHPAFLGTGSTFIGRCCETWDQPRYAKGQIDDVQIYGRSLTDTEVASLVAPPVTTSSPASCTEILLNGDSVGDGVYTIDPAQDGNDIHVYCDMTTDGGGWTLAGYGADSNLGGSLVTANGSYDPLNRTGSANIPSVALARMSTEVSLSWSHSVANGGLGTYAEAVGYAIPNPAAQTLDPGPLWHGYHCVSPYWTEVTVNALVGTPDLPSQMYTRTSSLGAVYGFAYGLAKSDGNPQCDWYIDGQGFKAVYLGINSDYSFRGVVYNPGGESSHVIPATMAIWFRGSVPDVPVDTTAPTISVDVTGTLGNNGWYVSDVAIAWTVTDDESAVTTSGCEAQLVASDTGDVTFTCTAESAGGTASESVTIKRDATSPVVTIASPVDGSSQLLNQAVAASYACSDALAGIASCAGTVASGAGIDTASVGTKSFAVTATDQAGNTASASVTYAVGYVFGGFRQPIPLPVSTFKTGSTIPVKFRLTDGAGASVGTAVATVSVNGGPSLGTAAYDASAQQYHFNLKTRGLAPGPITITVTLDDGSTHSAAVTLK